MHTWRIEWYNTVFLHNLFILQPCVPPPNQNEMDPLRKGVYCSISAPEKKWMIIVQSSITSIGTLLHPFACTNSDLFTHGSNVRNSPDPLQKLPSIYLRSTSVCGVTINNSLPITFLADQLDPRHTNRDSGIVQLYHVRIIAKSFD